MNYRMMEWTPENIARFWDYESQFPENYFTNQVGEAVVKTLSKYFPSAKSALDYGCGPGFLIPHLMDHGLQVSAVEFSHASVEKTKLKFGHDKNFLGAFEPDGLVKSGKRFDLIFMVEVVEHLDDGILGRALDSVRVLLSEKGVLVITTPNDEDLSKSFVYCPESDSVFHRWQHVRSWSSQTLADHMAAADFEVVDCFETNFSSYYIPTVTPSVVERFRVAARRVKRALLGCPHLPSKYDGPKLPHLVCIAKNKF